jgi:hypothetical protein
MAEGVYGQNLTDLLMLGGYAVSAIDTATGIEEYTPLHVYSVWTDLSYGKDIQPGIFIGYTQNLGADDKIVGTYNTRVSNIDKIFRVTPRVIFNFSKVRFATEVEFTSTSYGKTDEFGKVTDTKDILNIRGLIAVYYFF